MENSDKLASHLAGIMARYPQTAGGRMTQTPFLDTGEIIAAARTIIAAPQEQTEALLKLLVPFPGDNVSRCLIRFVMTTILAVADINLSTSLDQISIPIPS